MHRLIRDHLEQVLAAPGGNHSGSAPNSADVKESNAHLAECEACRDEIAAMREQAEMLRELRADVEPRPGFYARVLERIEAQGAGSIWNAFSESAFSRRIAVASMALALLLGVYLVATEPLQTRSTANAPIPIFIGTDQSGMELSSAGLPDRDAVLVNLVTYQEQ
ncbi:MAG TPA: hypothetical protein VK419_14495 [Bryobacteraceae bacterium]|nr:hypothetical protein [Bryobacteraceae bacterium]